MIFRSAVRRCVLTRSLPCVCSARAAERNVVWPLAAVILSVLCSSRMAAAQTVETVAGNYENAHRGDGGPALRASVAQTFGVVTGPDEALYVCEVGTHVIRRVDSQTGLITTVVGTGQQGYSGNGEQATAARLNEPYEVRFAGNGDMYFVEMKNHIVRCVDRRTGVIRLVAGTGEPGFSGDGGPASKAQLQRPHSIALDNDGNLYICDIGNHRIRRVVLATGLIDTFAGTGEKRPTPDGSPFAGTPLNGPRALDFDGQHGLVLALREGNAIYRMDLQSQTYQHVAGTGRKGYSGDGGPAIRARLSGPKGVALAADGDIYFADTESHTVRVVRAATGRIETVIGDGQRGNGPDGAPQNCRLNRPHGVCLDADGRIYVGDTNNHCVRRLTPAAAAR